ncbi:MAG: urea carboxylase-associated family protein [Firmicutes bacterium]|nr:urea carboxylase-associated family protein [Bacillota bacterium]
MDRYSLVIPPNSGRSFLVRKGQRLTVSGTTIADFVLFNADNLRERFDQARTKANQGKIFISVGDWLISRWNNPMMQIVEDGFIEGHHDLQEGMCSARRYQLVAERGDLTETYKRPITAADIPDHGCTENLTEALRAYQIAPEDIPSPFNLFQNMVIDAVTGKMSHSPIRPRPGSSISFVAAMNCLCAISACPDITIGGKEIQVAVGPAEG